VAEYFRKRRQVDPHFGHACREGVTEVVENQTQLNAGFARPLAETIKRVVYPGNMPVGIPLRGKDPGRLQCAFPLPIKSRRGKKAGRS
jgi:hypothetical protein